MFTNEPDSGNSSDVRIPVTTRSDFRRGAMLIYIAMLLPICMGALALVLDVGMSMTTARQMQSATDFGALEGLRLRDSGESELDQRTAVADAMKLVFDDDMNLANGDTMNFGAGPVLTTLTPGRTQLNASETLDFANPSVYEPDPALNLLTSGHNVAHGDMVSGWYFDSARHDEGYNANPYDRNDFQPETLAGAQPAGSGEAFLVRMRRTSSYATAGLDNQAEVATAGPPVPALFGRGTMMKGGDPNGTGEVRHGGVTVRATSIAVAHRAMSLGPAIPQNLFGAAPANLIRGYAPFAIEDADWNNNALFPQGAYSNEVQIDAAGVLQMDLGAGSSEAVGELHRVVQLASPVMAGDTLIAVSSAQGFNTPGGDEVAFVPFTIRVNNELMTVTSMGGGVGADATAWQVRRGEQGTTVASHDNEDAIYLHKPLVFADRIEQVDRPGGVGLEQLFGSSGARVEFWVPIYNDQGGSVGRRVVGFGIVTVDASSSDPLANRYTIRKEATMIAPENASSVRVTRTFDAAVTGTAGALNNLFAARRSLAEPLRAPSLASAQSR